MDIDSVAVPERFARRIVAFVEDVPEDALLAFFKSNPALLKGGFRPVPGKTEPLREHLRQMVPVSDAARALLADTGFCREFTRVLSAEALAVAFDALAASYGEELVVAAMLLDPRKEVREAVRSYAREHPDPAPAADAPDPAALRAQLGPFLGHLKTALDGARPEQDAGKAGKRANEELSTALSEKTKALHELTRERRARERAEESHRKSVEREKSEADAQRKKAEKAEAARQAALTDQRAAEDECRALRESLGETVRTRVAEELASAVRTWYRPAERLTDAAKTGRDPLEAAEKVLRRQAEHDLLHGNRTRLEERLRRAETLRAEMGKAERSALAPLPELKDARERLDGEIASLRERLALPVPPDAAAERLLAAINAAPTIEALAEVRRAVESLGFLGLLAPQALREAYRACHRRTDLLYDTGGVPDGGRTDLRAAAAGSRPAVLLIDGHNVIGLLPDVFPPPAEGGLPGKEARDRLVAAVAGAFGGREGLSVRLHFDSPEPGVAASSGISVVYSGGGGEHRADARIEEEVEFKAAEGKGILVFVVSGDRRVAEHAAARGGAAVSPAEFWTVVETLSATPRRG